MSEPEPAGQFQQRSRSLTFSTHVPNGSSMKIPALNLMSWLPANEIAVDLGTANTLIYVKGEGIVLNEPSVVAIEKSTGKIKGIGLEAKRMLGRTPDGILAVRPMKDGVIADFDVTEKMLRYFLKTIIEKHVFRVKPKVIVCVPSGHHRSRAARGARLGARPPGAKEVLMVAEPMAAAIGVGLPVETPTGNMVIDIGGGTTEIAVIALSGIVSDTSIRTGGDELDQAIVQFMRKNYNLLIGEPTAEAIKIKIGSAAPIGEEREMEVKGRDLVSGIPKTVRVHSTEIREAVQEPIQQIVDAVRRALEITPPELASDIVDRGIVMTGGGALIRGLDLLLAQETGLPIHVDEDPLTCVVRGTGRILDDYEKYRSVLSVLSMASASDRRYTRRDTVLFVRLSRPLPARPLLADGMELGIADTPPADGSGPAGVAAGAGRGRAAPAGSGSGP